MLIRHLCEFGHLSISICGDELFDDHKTSTDSNNQLTIQDLGINLLGSEQIESISNLSNWHWAVSLVDVVGEHLIEYVTLWHLENRFLLLVLDLSVHELDDLVLVLDEELKLLDLVDLGGDGLTKLVESIDQELLVLSESLDVSIVSFNVVSEVNDLTGEKLDLLVEVNFLLSQVVELQNLVVDDELSLLKGKIDLGDLVLDLLDLLLGVVDHLITIFDLVLELPCELLLLSLLVVFVEQLLSLV